jgi:hypothetical protein
MAFSETKNPMEKVGPLLTGMFLIGFFLAVWIALLHGLP